MAQRPTEAEAAQSAARGQGTARVVAAASTFLASLDANEQDKGLFPYTDARRTTGWSNLPGPMFQRSGLRLGDLTAKQRELAMGLVASALSREGYQKVTDIMNGDEALKNMGGGRTGGRPGAPPPGAGRGPGGPGGRGPAPGGRGGGVQFGRDEYYIALFGPPSATTPWMLQFGGHHLAINVTVVGPSSVLTPSLPAAQPASFTLNGQTIRPLGDEHDKSYALINSMNAAQQKQAILAYDVRDLVLGPGNDGKVIQPEGILASQLTDKQQTMLLDLAHEWVGILNDGAADAKMAEIKSNLSKTYFAWSGRTTDDGLGYFRIQGPTLLIEYSPQQGDRDHIHTIYRDPTNDYGAKLVRK
jgi:hypothetical protein